MNARNPLRTAIPVIAAVIAASLTSGCWDRYEVESLGFVTATAIDPADTPPNAMGWTSFDLTVQIASTDLGGGGGDGASGILSSTSAQATGTVITGRGFSPLDALNQIQDTVPRQVYIAHNRVVVIAEELARTEMRQVLDFFHRARQTRREALLVVARGIPAKEAIAAEFPLAGKSGEGLFSLIRLTARVRGADARTIHDFLVDTSLEGIDPYLGVLVPAPTDPNIGSDPPPLRVMYSGIALFRGDRLVGYLDDREARGLLWALGRVTTSHIQIPCPHDPSDPIAIEIHRSRGNVVTEFRPEIRGRIEVVMEGRLTEVGCAQDFERTSDSVEEVHHLAVSAIKEEISAAVTRAQMLQSDAFGFGAALFRRSPRTWREVSDRWYEEIWPYLPVDIDVKLDIRRPGLTAGPYSVDR